MFKDMDTASGSNSGVFFTQGIFGVLLEEVEYRANGYKGRSVIFKFKVTDSQDSAHPVGASRVWILKPFDGTPDQKKRTMADIKKLVFALLGKTEKEIGTPEQSPKAHTQATQLFLAACEEEYATKNNVDPKFLLGRKCALEVQAVPTGGKDGKAAGTFSRHVWGPATAAVAAA